MLVQKQDQCLVEGEGDSCTPQFKEKALTRADEGFEEKRLLIYF
jgi:hypothetical protein